jgi:PAS domain S-box-containing protein
MVRLIHTLRKAARTLSGAFAPRDDIRYRQLFENVPDGVYESAPDGRILAANAALVRMLGFETPGQLRREISATKLYADPEQRREFKRILENQGRLQNAELELIRRDGTRITVLENACAVRDGLGRILHYQGTLTDITERKTAERELTEARDKALEASRLKSAFLANMSHELRTPLNAVVGMASLLVGSKLDERQTECAETILSSSRFLIDIIGELLDFSRIEAGRLELERGVFRLRRTVEEAASMLGGRAAAGRLELICDIHREVPDAVVGDGPRLQQVLTNLIVNALKFTEQGEIVVAAAPTENGRIRFEVSDSGIGIDDKAREIIFEPFRQADGSTTRRYGGAGLGLAIARQLVSAMGGRLECTARPEGGSLFYFDVAFEKAPGVRPGRPTGLGALAGKRVALCETNERTRQVVAHWLREWGMVVLAPPAARSEADICLVASSAAGGAVCALAGTSCTAGGGGKCLRLLPFGHTLECPDPHTTAVSKPVRELDLQEAMLRLLTPEPAAAGTPLLMLSRRLTAPPKRLRILAAEDNALNQKVIARLLDRLGHAAQIAQNGTEALQAAVEEPFDLILMDCQMPEMDGFQATAELRRRGVTLPVVALTAHAVQGDRDACLAAGMDDYLTKPIVLDDLAAVIDRWCTRTTAARDPAGARTPATD